MGSSESIRSAQSERTAPSSRSSLRVLLGLDPGDDGSPIVALKHPRDRVTFRGGERVHVEWRSSGAVAGHRVQLSLDDGKTYEDVSPELPGGARSYDLQLPNQGTEWGRIKVLASDSAGGHAFASSLAPFIIEKVVENGGAVKLLAPLGWQVLRGGESITVRWRCLLPGDITYELQLSTDGGESFDPVLRSIPGRVQALRWRVPDQPTHAARLRIVTHGPGEARSWDESAEDLVIVTS
jgi:hypothetical protein